MTLVDSLEEDISFGRLVEFEK